jgi:2-(1,2-epoxy-1,2-dihydrophenyl)acetyl-CoA isomerase
MNDTVLLARDGTVATLTLNRPDTLNALDLAMVDALIARTAEVAADDALRVVVVRGAGKHFMAGGDIRTFATHLDEPPAVRRDGFRRMVERLHAAIECLHRMPHPVVGRVHGAVAGFGLSLMNACDLVVASEDAYFASAYRQIALTPDGGGSWSLPRLVGLRKAMEIFLVGERFGAAEALALGIVNKVVPRAELDAATAARWIADGTISGGMIPKVQACLHSVSLGVPARIVDGRSPGAIARAEHSGTAFHA